MKFPYLLKTRYFAFVFVAVSFNGYVYAGGIPTYDALNNAQQIMEAGFRAADAAAQLKAAMDDMERAKSEWSENKSLITGNSGYGSGFTDPAAVSYIPTTPNNSAWEQIYSNMDKSVASNMSQKYGLKANTPVQQEALDKQMQDFRYTQDGLAANNQRLKNIENLQKQADTATTPQQKQDIANRIASEQAAVANESNRIAMVENGQKKQEAITRQRVNNDFSTFLEGK
ncbi:hypothetical protein YA0783_25085 [Pseudomonas corrugata]|uniref:type IV secretion system protein n=1 Tax=Pseudomonas corrugata TaxID=47879 RepID=UPI0018E5C2C6|nr:type IV secretion system protein [Pseudomonas corrugata]MBI6621566.1 hypothetical protein [Pseudomonas corrugata]MBI6694199.1 hypothetical protein [Pseudomonas corrugata]